MIAPMVDLDVTAQLDALRQALAGGGMPAALALLNDRTHFRFTGVYKLSGDVMLARHIHDRVGEQRTWPRVIPLSRSFCGHVLAHGEFMTRAASFDQRIPEHPYPGLIEGYYGCLLRQPGGQPWGTLFHFDMNPCELPKDEIAFLARATPLLATHLD